jgi:hypothetical protein
MCVFTPLKYIYTCCENIHEDEIIITNFKLIRKPSKDILNLDYVNNYSTSIKSPN